MKMILLVLSMVLLLTGCADNIPYDQVSKVEPVGFLHGLWHGIIIVFAFIWSLFDDSAAIYAAYNNGGWYDFGFVIGILARVAITFTRSNKRTTSSRQGRR